MRTFSARTCNQTVEYAAATYPDNARGNAKPSFPAPGQGVPLAASVQPVTLRRVDPDGQVITVTGYRVFLRDDPSALNGGVGIREGDGFRYAGKLIQSQGPPFVPGESGACWKVECLDVE